MINFVFVSVSFLPAARLIKRCMTSVTIRAARCFESPETACCDEILFITHFHAAAFLGSGPAITGIQTQPHGRDDVGPAREEEEVGRA